MLHSLPRNYLSVLWLQLTVCNQVCQWVAPTPIFHLITSSTPNCVTNIYIGPSLKEFQTFTFKTELPILHFPVLIYPPPFPCYRNQHIIPTSGSSQEPGHHFLTSSQLRTTSNVNFQSHKHLKSRWFSVVCSRRESHIKIKRIPFSLPTWRNDKWIFPHNL